MTYMLDTNTCLDFLLARSDLVAARIRRDAARLSVSAITAAELRVGNRTSKNPEQDARKVDLFLSTITTHPFDDAAAATYGDVVQRVGLRRTSFDRLIGAHAMALGLIVVTNNERHFADIPGLRVENWTQ
jgi:tRNA(fMet)-specific endonuclease VapC